MNCSVVHGYCVARGIDFRTHEPMAAHTSLRIGGPADVVLFSDEGSLPDTLRFLQKEKLPYVVVGNGTNILVRDEGIEGVALFTAKMDDIRTDGTDSTRVLVQSGCPLRKVIRLSIEHGLSGAEGLVGIPGSVGGAIAGNAGSFGYEIKDVLHSATVAMADGALRTFSGDALGWGYRTSHLPPDSVIMSSVMSLRKDDPHDVRRRVREFMNQKVSLQPVGKSSAGCVFRNSGGVSAGKLIDEAGCKGMRIGAAEVSTLHANFFINSGGGTAEDFLRLMDVVAERVKERFGVVLEPEIKVLGRNSLRR